MHKSHYILIVDDEPINQLILDEELSDHFELDFADNGEDCLKSIQNRCPDLLLLDGKMPNMNGIEVCQFIRASDNQSRKIPIIMLSANASQIEKKKGLAAGANVYLSKPFDMDHLQQLIRTHISN